MKINELIGYNEGNQKLMFTPEEIEMFLQKIKSSYEMTMELLHANKSGILIRHRDRTNQGQSLIQSSIAELTFLLAIPKGHLARGGEKKQAMVSQDVYQGAMSLVGTLVSAEHGVDQETEVLLVSTVTNIALRHKDLYGSDMPLPDQIKEYLGYVSYARRCGSIFEEDRSGFILVDWVVNNSSNHDSELYISIPCQPRDFFDAGLRGAADLYKEIYLVGSQAGLGPPPKA